MTSRRPRPRRYRPDRPTVVFVLAATFTLLRQRDFAGLGIAAAALALIIGLLVAARVLRRRPRARSVALATGRWPATVLTDAGPPGWAHLPLWKALLVGDMVSCQIVLDPGGLHVRPGPISRRIGVQRLTVPWAEVTSMAVRAVGWARPDGTLCLVTNHEITVDIGTGQSLTLLMPNPTDLLGRAGTLRRDYGTADNGESGP